MQQARHPSLGFPGLSDRTFDTLCTWMDARRDFSAGAGPRVEGRMSLVPWSIPDITGPRLSRCRARKKGAMGGSFGRWLLCSKRGGSGFAACINLQAYATPMAPP